MTKDEVLERLADLVDQYSSSLEAIDGSGSKLVEIYRERLNVYCSAAELIRQSGWRPIAEAPPMIPPGRLGWWGTEKWYEVVTQYPIPKLNAHTLGYTHYFPFEQPEPPAREVWRGE